MNNRSDVIRKKVLLEARGLAGAQEPLKEGPSLGEEEPQGPRLSGA